MKRNTTPSYVITLRMYPTDKQLKVLEHRFNVVHHITNVMVKHARGCIDQLQRNKDYVALLQQTKNRKLTQEEKDKFKELRLRYGLSEYDFHSYVSKQKYLYESSHIGIHVAQKIASKVWNATSKVLFSSGKEVHFKKKNAVNSFEGKSNTTNIMFSKDTMSVSNHGLTIRCDYPRKDNYIKYALENCRIKYCRIKRKWHKHSYRYYVDLVMEGLPPIKQCYGESVIGIDIGPSTIALVSDDRCELKELAEDVNSIEKELRVLQRRRDRQSRYNNPDNYNEDGTVKKGRKHWYKSRRMIETEHKIKQLYRKRANRLRQSHIDLANKILAQGSELIVEDMYWSALAKKAKETKVNDKTGRYQKKKRLGKSIANHAPSMLINILDRKLTYIGKEVTKVDCFKTAASKYNHVTDEKMNVTLKDRYVNIDNHSIQRDLHAAFNLRHIIVKKVKKDKKIEKQYSYNLELMNLHFDEFVKLHDHCITELKIEKQNGIKFPSCMSI